MRLNTPNTRNVPASTNLFRFASQATRTLWNTDRPLAATGLLMSAVLLVSVLAMWADPRTISGAPAWLKPAKFAASTAIYSLTLAWMFRYLPSWIRTRRIVGWTTAATFIVEVAIIDVQAWRGTTSHFNVSTPLDATLFAVMGVGILIQTIVTGAVAVALWRESFDDRALGWALRLGLTLSIVGAFTGGLMTRPTAAQLDAARATHHLPTAGAHTVGAADGGAGLPITGWSTRHGDLRVPHFIGLHAVQFIPLIVVAVRRRLPERAAVGATLVASASYAGLFGLLLVQALRGQSVLHPDEATAIAFGVWALATVSAGWFITASRSASCPTVVSHGATS